MIPIFCYGSNHLKQLKHRIGREGLIASRAAVLHGYCRVFAGYSERWGGGVASIHPCKRAKVYGSIVYLTRTEVAKLSGFEMGYSLREVAVAVVGQSDEDLLQAYAYIKDDPTYQRAPSEKYLEAIRQMLQENYIRDASRIPIKGVDANTGKIMKYGTWSTQGGLLLMPQNIT